MKEALAPCTIQGALRCKEKWRNGLPHAGLTGDTGITGSTGDTGFTGATGGSGDTGKLRTEDNLSQMPA